MSGAEREPFVAPAATENDAAAAPPRYGREILESRLEEAPQRGRQPAREVESRCEESTSSECLVELLELATRPTHRLANSRIPVAVHATGLPRLLQHMARQYALDRREARLLGRLRIPLGEVLRHGDAVRAPRDAWIAQKGLD